MAARCKYAHDGPGAALGELAKRLDAWVRLHYVYPYPHVDEVVELMAAAAEAGRRACILPYLDVPLAALAPRAC
jgi:ribosomal protein S12 methylthiotransferase